RRAGRSAGRAGAAGRADQRTPPPSRRVEVARPEVALPARPSDSERVHEHGHRVEGTARLLGWALAANALLTLVQILGGVAFGSLSLLADAAHQAVDVVALGSVLVAQRLAQRPAAGRRTYGWQRADVLASLGCAVLLLASCVWILVE